MKKIRVVNIDDSVSVQCFVKEHLKGTQFSLIATGESGKEAITLYKKHRPDVMLLDIVMPEMSGVEALQAIKDEFEEAKVVILSNYGTKEYVEQCESIGISGVLEKPFDEKDLFKILGRSCDCGETML